MDEQERNENKGRGKRGLTSVTLQWIAEKLRRTTQIKAELQRGTYRVDSNKVAEAILNGETQSKS